MVVSFWGIWIVSNLQKVSWVLCDTMQGVQQSQGWHDRVNRCVTDLPQFVSK